MCLSHESIKSLDYSYVSLHMLVSVPCIGFLKSAADWLRWCFWKMWIPQHQSDTLMTAKLKLWKGSRWPVGLCCGLPGGTNQFTQRRLPKIVKPRGKRLMSPIWWLLPRPERTRLKLMDISQRGCIEDLLVCYFFADCFVLMKDLK